jgi:hypothetical protein
MQGQSLELRIDYIAQFVFSDKVPEEVRICQDPAGYTRVS